MITNNSITTLGSINSRSIRTLLTAFASMAILSTSAHGIEINSSDTALSNSNASLSNTFNVVNRTGDLCLAPKSDSTRRGVNVSFTPCNDGEAEQWTINDKNIMVHKASNKCLVTINNNKKLSLWSCRNTYLSDVKRIHYISILEKAEKTSISQKASTSQKTCSKLSTQSKVVDYRCNNISNNTKTGWLLKQVVNNDTMLASNKA